MGSRAPCWILDDPLADAVVGTPRPREELRPSQEGMEDLQACFLLGSGARLWEGVVGPQMNSVRRDAAEEERGSPRLEGTWLSDRWFCITCIFINTEQLSDSQCPCSVQTPGSERFNENLSTVPNQYVALGKSFTPRGKNNNAYFIDLSWELFKTVKEPSTQ